jgi:hypothetical protein
MTELLEQAITKLKTMSASEQDSIAAMISEEIEADLCWDESLARSPVLLAQMAASAMAEHHGGKTQELNLETM